MDRNQALKDLQEPLEVDDKFLDYCKKRLGYSDSDFDIMMNKPIRSYMEFETYIPYFLERIDKLKILADAGKLPSTFVEKLLIPRDKMLRVV